MTKKTAPTKWVCWEVRETSHEWIEWCYCPDWFGATKEEALIKAAQGYIDTRTKKPLKIREESPWFFVCLPEGEVPYNIPYEKS